MGKIGFINDVVRGIKKVAGESAPVATVVKETIVPGTSNVAPLLKRAFMFLEDGDWTGANEYCEKVLDMDPENAQAYLGKLMAELQVKTQDDLKRCAEPFTGLNNYQKTMRFADEDLKRDLLESLDFIQERKKNEHYTAALSIMAYAKVQEDYMKASLRFEELGDYKDAKQRVQECLEQAEVCRINSIYNLAMACMSAQTERGYTDAKKYFQLIPDWNDARNKIAECDQKIEAIRLLAEERELKRQAELLLRKKCLKKIILIGIPIVALVATFVLLLNYVIIPNQKYNDARSLMNAGKYTEAIEAFEKLNGYSDSARQIDKCINEMIKNPKIGDAVFFGTYEQDNNTANGQEEIEWIVLDKKNGKALIISKYGLDFQRYNTTFTDVTWETCTLRNWLNTTFYTTAFNANQQSKIASTTLTNADNPSYGTQGGNDTTDKVFLLSIDEVKRYFASNTARKLTATAYAKAHGAYVVNSDSSYWWLRSPGYFSDIAASVSRDGSVYYDGDRVYIGNNAVRPALWINLES
ncbi:MAG: hypothetical protein IKV74_03705 [Clostridia bacterium]|nr:hypothetical protein [Clostridia bacterium]